ncbi:MAG: hypothetical protein RJA36_1413 [Pseudomonadota bacterium]|jgi:hypothetical protein
MPDPCERLLQALQEIADGSDHTGRWLDADGSECEEGDEGARWEEFTAEEQSAWLDSVAEIARRAIAEHKAQADDPRFPAYPAEGVAAAVAMVDTGDREPTHARLPDGSIVPWDERLQTVDCAALYLLEPDDGYA